jgi:hypothetical protein
VCLVTEERALPPEGSAAIDVAVARTHEPGDFPTGLWIFPISARANAAVRDGDRSQSILERVCRATGADCLITDERVAEPDVMKLIRRDGSVEWVRLDQDRLDREGVHIVARLSQRPVRATPA